MTNQFTLGFNFGGQEMLLILLIVFLLFGASRLPQLAKAMGQSKRAFREGMDEAEEEERLEAARRQQRRERLRAAGDDLTREDTTARADEFTVNKPRT
ncbi:MAG TPA: twin-arginine translocase TatA/TatE family subunit [Pyrinomonadaceae bacterium]|jgi:sec-independent protein translocase protein TatA|nr:twin-arginine translocase TatA/TatE family subunit [Pyrinomonadaceae bacterium]